MAKEEQRKKVFEDVLSLLRLEAQKFGTMVELVESLAWQHIKEDKKQGHEKLTQRDRDNLFDYVPWTFIPNTADFSMKVLHRKNRVKFGALKSHLAAIKSILEGAEMLP